ncbi:MAG: EF-hand domain-containing protein [Erythrobacter sp.]|nr:EF-hand domain-containing protein [Erythrobacter sp.]
MNRILLGAVLGLVLAGIGVFWWQGRAEVEQGAPPPDPSALGPEPQETGLPTADGAGLVGPAPPEATELTREQRRFFRYDRNRDWKISRTEMLSTRTDAFRKLDTDGNNLLTFEEWAVATANRFDTADADGNGELSPSEFATTRPKPRAKPACRC